MPTLTRKQFSILDIVVTGNPEGESEFDKLIDIDQMIERVPYVVSKASIHFSIRSMIEGGYIQKVAPQYRRGRNRVLFSATKSGKYRMNPNSAGVETSFISSVEEDEIFGDPDSEYL